LKSAEHSSGKKNKPKRTGRNLLLLFSSISILLIILELVFRWMLFGNSPSFQNWRNPGLYASVFSDEYWKLSYYWNTHGRPPPDPHPLLGWTGLYDRGSLVHYDFPLIGKRRPVLLFGDSFSQCIDTVKCFQKFLNSDTAFAKDNFLLNYGTGGFGLDQIYLLAKQTVPHYKDPLVVFGFLTTDIDRSILTFRTGQKPWYSLEADSLKLNGFPVWQDTDSFIHSFPPQITSYLWRRFLHSRLNFLPWKCNPGKKEEFRFMNEARSINEKIIVAAATEFRKMNIDFVFLIFHHEDLLNEQDAQGGWRDTFLLRVLTENEIPFIWTKDIVKKDTGIRDYQFERYIIPGDGHPTSYFNSLISRAIADSVFAHPPREKDPTDLPDDRYFESRIAKIENLIRNDPAKMQKITESAARKKEDLDILIRRNAVMLLNRELENQWGRK